MKWAQRAAGGVARRASRQYLRSSQASEPSQSQRSWLQPLAQGYPNCDPRRPLHPCRSSCRSLLGIADAVPVGVASAVALDWYRTRSTGHALHPSDPSFRSSRPRGDGSSGRISADGCPARGARHPRTSPAPKSQRSLEALSRRSRLHCGVWRRWSRATVAGRGLRHGNR